MPRGCTVCAHSELATINKAIAVRGETQRAVAKRFGFTQTSLNRHSRNCLGIKSTKEEAAGTRSESSVSVVSRNVEDAGNMSRADRFASAVRLLNEALDLLEQSKREKDRTTALKALKEARDCLALVMRAEGDLADTNANVDARSVHLNMFPNWKPDELRALIAALPGVEKPVTNP